MTAPLIEWKVKWTAKKNLRRMNLNGRIFLQHLAPVLFGRFRARTLLGMNTSGQPMTPLTDKYARYKRWKGLNPIRDGRYSGRMWQSATATFDSKDRFRLRFDGTRTTKRGKVIRNQRIADLLAGEWTRTREEWQEFHRQPASGATKPHNEFMGADASDEQLILKLFDSMVIARAVRTLPDDLPM